jgi:PadR family transcriptional regulator PadR
MSLDREWMRGAAPLAVLTLLASGEMYGYELVEALERRSGRLLELGQSTVYPLLYNLQARGFVEPTVRLAPNGRERKYYRITAAGRAWLDRQQRQWSTLVEAFRRIGVPESPRASGPEPEGAGL